MSQPPEQPGPPGQPEYPPQPGYPPAEGPQQPGYPPPGAPQQPAYPPAVPQQPGYAPPGYPPPEAGYLPPGPEVVRSGFWRRFAAFLIDAVLLSIVGMVIGQIFGQEVATFRDGVFSYQLTDVPAVVFMVVNLAYYAGLEGTRGATLGKMALGIRVADMNTGQVIGFGKAFIRWIGRIVSGLPCFLGYFWMLWDKNKQTWHDKFADSLVVRTPR